MRKPANACWDRSHPAGDRGFCLPGHHLHQPREGYRYWPHPCHRRHREDHPAFTSRGRVGACRRDRVGGGRSEEGVVPLRGARLCTQGALDEFGGDRDGEFALHPSDRNRRHLAGSPDHEGTNLKKKI